ncbi:MAG TPA: hypothetical protein VF618_01525 [Thermoanaerobaculia bacterium]
MWSTVLRLGLWILIAVLGLYVFKENSGDPAITELITDTLLQQAMLFALALIALSVVLRLFDKTSAAVAKKNRCQVCKTPIPPGAIYCRTHLRRVLDDEDARTHLTRVRR